VGKVTDVKVLHCISSLSKSSKVIEGVLRFDVRPSGSRGSAGVHSCTAIGFAESGVSVAVDFFVAAASNSRVRFLRAIFCLRSRWNLDLSPFTADILDSFERVSEFHDAARQGRSQLREHHLRTLPARHGLQRALALAFAGARYALDLSIAKAQYIRAYLRR